MFSNILIYFVIIPLLMLGGFALCRDVKQIRAVAVTGSTVLIGLSAWLLCDYLALRAAGETAEMLYCGSWTWFEPLHINLAVGVDGVSIAMLILSSIIVFAGSFASWKIDDARHFFMWLLLLSTGVFGFFISIDLFTMFMFYEVALIPMYLLIGVWGTGRKEYSAMKLTLMLMGGSAFLMLSLIGIYYHSAPEGGELTWNILEIARNNSISTGWQYFLFPMCFVGFGVLGAMFPFHTWSPDGHACAPTAVSMLHAGVLMKLGGYGCFRVAMYLMPEAANDLAWIFLILTGISVVYGAFSACVQTDLKYINAYSSVSHCGMVLFAILMINTTALTGAIMQMLSHGLMTALFFALIGMIYGRTHTRDIRLMGGLMKIMPFLGVGYVIAGIARSSRSQRFRGRNDNLRRIVRSRYGRLLCRPGLAPSGVHHHRLLVDCNHSGLHPACCGQAAVRSGSGCTSSRTHRRHMVGAPFGCNPRGERGSHRMFPQLLRVVNKIHIQPRVFPRPDGDVIPRLTHEIIILS